MWGRSATSAEQGRKLLPECLYVLEGGSTKSVDRTPLTYQAIESKNGKKKTIKQKREKRKINETESWGFEKIKLTSSRHSEEGEQKAEMTSTIIIGN